MTLMFVLFLALLNKTNGKYRETDSCPSGIVHWRRREASFQCPTKLPYHCILKYNTSQLYETCIAAVTIGPGQVGCPSIKFYKGRTVHGSKNSECPMTNSDCPPTNHKGYLSNQLYQYPACFLDRSARLSKTATFTGKVPSTTVQQETNYSPASDNATDQSFQTWTVVVIVFGVLIVLVAVVLMIIIIRKRKIRGRCTSNGGSSQDPEEESKKFIEMKGTGIKKKIEGDKDTQDIHSDGQCEEGVKTSQQAYLQGEISIKDKESTNHQHEDISDEDLVNRIFRGVLDISDGIVSYYELLMHFEQKDDCLDITGDLENILKGHRNVFRLLVDESICFVIAYLFHAKICDNYNQPSLGARCIDPSCSKFHICQLYVKGMCKEPHCNRSHTYGDAHNMKVKDRLGLCSYSDSDINKILLNCYPKICSIAGCDKEKDCPFLHMCSAFCFGKCLHGSQCKLKHTFRTEHNVWILNAYDIPVEDIWTGSLLARKLTIAKNT